MPRGFALVSLHDVTPAYGDLVRKAIKEVESWGIGALALAVVPNFHGRWPLKEFKSFTTLVKAAQERGSDILLHGYTHQPMKNAPKPRGIWERAKARFLTDGEGEFQTLELNDAVSDIQRGAEMLDLCFGFRPEGFVAPAWLEHADTAEAVRAVGLRFHENHLHVKILEQQQKHLIPAIVFSSRTSLRLRASKVLAKSLQLMVGGTWPLRLCLHPVDFASKEMIEAVQALAMRMRVKRDFITYSQFYERFKARP